MSVRRSSIKNKNKNSKVSSKRKSFSSKTKEWEADIHIPKKLFPKPARPNINDEDEMNQNQQYWAWRQRGSQHLTDMVEYLVENGEPTDIHERKRALGEKRDHLKLFRGDDEAITFIHDQLLLEGVKTQGKLNQLDDKNLVALMPEIPKDAHPHNYFHYLFGRAPTDDDILEAKHRLNLFQQRYSAVINEDIARSRSLIKKYHTNPILNKELKKDRYHREFKDKWNNLELQYEDNLSFVRGGTIPFDNMNRSAQHYLAWGDNANDVYSRAKKMVDGDDANTAWNMVKVATMINGKLETITVPYPTLTPVNDVMNIDIQPHRTYYTVKIRELERLLEDETLSESKVEKINSEITILTREMNVSRDNIKVELFGGLDTKLIPPSKIKDGSFYTELRKWVGMMGEEERSTAEVLYRYSVPEGFKHGSFDYMNTLQDHKKMQKILKGNEAELDVISFFERAVNYDIKKDNISFYHTERKNALESIDSYAKRFDEQLSLNNKIRRQNNDITNANDRILKLNKEQNTLLETEKLRGLQDYQNERMNEINLLLNNTHADMNRSYETKNKLESKLIAKGYNVNEITKSMNELMENEKWSEKQNILKELSSMFMIPSVEELDKLGTKTQRERATSQLFKYFNGMVGYGIYGYDDIRPSKDQPKAQYDGKTYVNEMTTIIYNNMSKERKKDIQMSDVKLAVLQAHVKMRNNPNSDTYQKRLNEERKYHLDDLEVFKFLRNDMFTTVVDDDSDNLDDMLDSDREPINLANARVEIDMNEEFANIKRQSFEKAYYKWAGKQTDNKNGKLHDVNVVTNVGSIRGETLNGYIKFLRDSGFNLTRPQITGIGKMTNSVGSIGFTPFLDEDDYGGNFVQHLRSVDRALTVSHATKNSTPQIKRTALRMLAEENHLIMQMDERGQDMPRVLSEASYPWLTDKKAEYLRIKTDEKKLPDNTSIETFDIGEEHKSFEGLTEGEKIDFQKHLKNWYDVQRFDVFPDDMRILNSPILVNLDTSDSLSNAVGYTRKTAKNQSFYFPPKGRLQEADNMRATITHELLHQLGRTDFLTNDHEEAGTEIETFARTGVLESGYIKNPVAEKEDLSEKLSMNGAIPMTEIHKNPYLFVPQLAWNSTLWKRAFLQQVTTDDEISSSGRVVLERIGKDGQPYFSEPQSVSAPLQSAVVKIEDDTGDVTVVHFNKGRTPFSEEEVKIALNIHDRSDRIMYDENIAEIDIIDGGNN